jgi:hypothetical protein
MDLIYQLIVFKWVYPTQLIVTVLLLAFVPYLLMRGIVCRMVKWWTTRQVRA